MAGEADNKSEQKSSVQTLVCWETSRRLAWEIKLCGVPRFLYLIIIAFQPSQWGVKWWILSPDFTFLPHFFILAKHCGCCQIRSPGSYDIMAKHPLSIRSHFRLTFCFYQSCLAPKSRLNKAHCDAPTLSSPSQRFSAEVPATVRISLRDGCFVDSNSWNFRLLPQNSSIWVFPVVLGPWANGSSARLVQVGWATPPWNHSTVSPYTAQGPCCLMLLIALEMT